AFEVDAARERAAFLTRHGQAIRTINERGTYLDEADVADLTDLPPPGLDELAALMRLADLAANPSSRVVVDTAPTGHTLRLLDLPGIALAWVSALEALEEKHAAVAAALAGAAVQDEATHLLGSLRSDLERLESLFRDPD